MILFERRGDIFASKAQTLVCPVNTVGTLGKGLALGFKLAYPDLLVPYQQACKSAVFRRDGFYIYTHSEDRKILCMPTKHHWRHDSKLVWIDESLRRLSLDWRLHGLTSVAIPAVGCGNGHLKWADVRPLIYEHLEAIDLCVEIYEP